MRTQTLAALAGSPALYPMVLDLARGALFLIRMNEADYRRASFLDERMLAPGTRGEWLALAAVERALNSTVNTRPLHFIFHSGHVGSTLLSRLLDETGKVLPLREPLPLRTLAEAYDGGASGLDARLEIFLRLWERGFEATEIVVLKATSAAIRLAPRLLTMRGQARAVLLNVGLESYLATMFAAENSAIDLNAHGPERLHRLGTLLDAPPPRPTTLGELAAMSWLVERMTQMETERLFGPRVLTVDFDRMLQSLEDTIDRVLGHFGVVLPPGQIAVIVEGQTLKRYSKAPEHGYSPSLRAELLAESRRHYAQQIRAAVEWLETLAEREDKIAALVTHTKP